MTICRVGVEYFCDFPRTRFLFLSKNLLPLGSNRPRSWVKLRNIEYGELVSANKLTRLLVMIGLLGREPTDDIRGQCHGWHLIAEKVAHFVEFFDCILAIHMVKNGI